jgi:uridine kinase
MSIERIIKRDGREVPFDPKKITLAVQQATVAVGDRDSDAPALVTADVIGRLESRQDAQSVPTVEEVQDLVETALIERGYARVAKAYIIYRYEHTLKRAGRRSLAYSSDAIPYRKLWQALSWGVDHGCVRLADLSKFDSPDLFPELVANSEAFFNNEIATAAQAILERTPQPCLVIVAGPSSSGKTTTTIKVGEHLAAAGRRFVALNVDNYFFDLESHPADATGDRDFETPQALDLELIRRHLEDLFAGRSIEVPSYNFKTGRREGIEGEMHLEEGDIVLIDSLHGMYEGMTGDVPDELKFKLYIETLSQLKNQDGRYIRWADLRLLRRMTRDSQFRGYAPFHTLTHWHFVRRSELRYIVARSMEANVIVNSFLPYELPVFKARLHRHFPELLEQVRADPEREDARERAQRIMALFEQIPVWTDESFVPGRSLLREFIGGSEYSY